MLAEMAGQTPVPATSPSSDRGTFSSTTVSAVLVDALVEPHVVTMAFAEVGMSDRTKQEHRHGKV